MTETTTDPARVAFDAYNREVYRQSNLDGLWDLEPFKERWERVAVDVVEAFVAAVNARAEANMLKTGKLEGAHFNAMQALVKEMRGE